MRYPADCVLPPTNANESISVYNIHNKHHIHIMAPATKKRRRSPYSCADAVTSLLDTLVTKEAEEIAEQPDATPSSTATTASTTVNRPVVLTPQAVQAMMICHEQFLQILAAELAMRAEEDASAADNANAAAADSATGLSVVQSEHVMSALQQLGWEESAPPVVLSSKKSKRAKIILKRAPVPESGPKKGGKGKSRKKKKEWTTEELATQERLLAASKEKLEGQTEA